MAVWFLGPTKTTAPAAGCRGCTSEQNIVCPDELMIRVGCGNCVATSRLSYRYLGVLTCWQPSDGHCNPNLCCPWMRLDPWVGFRSGLWVSSTVIPVYVDCPNGGPQASTLIVNMFPASRSKAITMGAASGCGVTQVATITVFDDGTYTLA